MRRKKSLIIIASIILLILILCVGIRSCSSRTKTNDTGKDTVVKEESADDLMNEKHSDNENINNDSSTSISESNDTTDNTANTKTPTEESNNVGEKTTNHTHKWVAKQTVVKHPEKGHYEKVCVKEAWVEEVPKYEEIAVEVCGNCGAEFTTDPSEHIKEHMLNGTGTKGCRTEYRQIQVGVEQVSHAAEYTEKWVVDEKAKEETVTTYSCACGATK